MGEQKVSNGVVRSVDLAGVPTTELARELEGRAGVKVTRLAEGVHATVSERGAATILVVAEGQ